MLNRTYVEPNHILEDLIPYAKNNCVKDEHVMNVLQKLITINKGKFGYYAKLYDNKFELFKKIYVLYNQGLEVFSEMNLVTLVSEGFYEKQELTEELNNLVRLNFLAFNPTTSSYKLQGKSMFYGLKEYVEDRI